MRSARASNQRRYVSLRRSIGVARSALIEPKLVQKVGPPLAHAVTHVGTRKASSFASERGVFSGARCTACFSPSAAICRPSTLVAWCGYQGHGQPLARKGEFGGTREAFTACEPRGRYSAFRPAVVRAFAWPLPNPSTRTSPPVKTGC